MQHMSFFISLHLFGLCRIALGIRNSTLKRAGQITVEERPVESMDHSNPGTRLVICFARGDALLQVRSVLESAWVVMG